MKIYIAHNYAARQWILDEIKPKLEALDIEITSDWLSGNHTNREITYQAKYARIDLHDIVRADCLLYFASKFDGHPGCGKHIELGYALGLSREVVIVGTTDDLNSIFHYLDFYNIRRYTFLEDFLQELRMARIFKKI